MMKITACLFLALAFLLAACHKDDVDVNDLNFNPFDPGYVGPAIVELDHSYTDTYTTPGGGTIFRFNVVVQVRTDRLDHDTEYSLWSRDPEDGMLDVCRELGIGFVAYSPLGRGFLTGGIKTFDDLAPDDYRRHSPRLQGENFAKNLVMYADT